MVSNKIVTDFEILSPALGKTFKSAAEAERSFQKGDTWLHTDLLGEQRFVTIDDFGSGITVNLAFNNGKRNTTMTTPGTKATTKNTSTKSTSKASKKAAVQPDAIPMSAPADVVVPTTNNSNEGNGIMTFTKVSTHKNGLIAFGVTGLRGSIYVGKALFGTNPIPDTLEVSSASLLVPDADAIAKATARSERQAKRATNAAERLAKAEEKAAKAAKRVETLKAAEAKKAAKTAAETAPATDQPVADAAFETSTEAAQ